VVVAITRVATAAVITRAAVVAGVVGAATINRLLPDNQFPGLFQTGKFLCVPSIGVDNERRLFRPLPKFFPGAPGGNRTHV
jgi:hypothetical protein